MSELYLVSACLLGMCTTYNAASHPQPHLIALAARGQILPLCPEIAGGLSTPRPPAEIVGGDGHAVLDGQARVLTRDGQDVTAAFLEGARVALSAAQARGITVAILQPRSPSCGPCRIYDGHFDGHLVAGQGVTAALLARHGIRVLPPDALQATLWPGLVGQNDAPPPPPPIFTRALRLRHAIYSKMGKVFLKQLPGNAIGS